MRFFERVRKLEDIAGRDPRDCEYARDLSPLLQELPSAVYFYARIASAEWLPILEAGGCFAEMPDDMVGYAAVKPRERATLSEVRLNLLARLAKQAPVAVQRILARLPKPEDHTVRQQYVRVLLALVKVDTDGMQRMISEEIAWLEATKRIDALLSSQYADLACALVHHESQQAWVLAQALLLPVEAAGIRDAAWRQHELGFRLESWDYKRVLDRVTEEFVGAQATEGFRWICELFSIVLERLPGNARETDRRLVIWRPSIEDSDQNIPNDLLNWFIEAVREAGDGLVPELGDAVLTILQEPCFGTFRRIELHLRSIHCELDPIGSESLACDPAVLLDPVLRHELFRLLEACFGSFTESAQSEYFHFVDALNNPGEMYQCLWPIRMHLRNDRAATYSRLVDEFGELQHPDFTSYHEMAWVGPTSPFSVSEMKKLDVTKLVDRLNSWQFTPGDWHAPEPEGLARELAAFASQNAKRVSESAMAFEELQQPTWVRGIAQGLADAVKNGQPVSWDPLLHFCKWAVDQKRGEGPEGSGLEDFDHTWGPARKQIAWLLERGTMKSAAEIPFEFKGDVWTILGVLVEDPDPTEEEETSRSEHMDPSTIAINTVRGVALGAAFSFSLWVARHEHQKEQTWISLELADVQSAVEDRLAIDRSPAVRSVFGRWLPYVFGIDQQWTIASIERILPPGADEDAIWTASWDAYLTFCSMLYIEFLGLLRISYERALDRLGTERREKTRIADPDERVGHHLVLFYREGVLAPEDPLFTTFFEKADAKLRYSVMADAVRLVQDVADEKRGPAISRLQDLWEWRRKATIEEKADEYHELSSFGWWFLKDDFPPEWRLRQLLDTQLNGIALELDGRVLEKMIDLSEEHLPLVLDCLEAVVRNPAGGDWGMYDDHVREILRRGLDSDVKALHDQAENLVHYIGSLGYFSFRELLGV